MHLDERDRIAAAEPHVSRRDVVRVLASSGAAAVMGLTLAGPTDEAAAAGISDVDILNFALNAEYLEAEFYLIATTGTRLPASLTTGVGRPGPTTGGAQVPFA